MEQLSGSWSRPIAGFVTGVAREMVSCFLYSVDIVKICCENVGVDGTGSGSCPVVGFGVSGVRPLALFPQSQLFSWLISQHKIQWTRNLIFLVKFSALI
jgi:uncharacterized membrane protein